MSTDPEQKAACGYGAFGVCCCGCRYRANAVRDATAIGFVCTQFYDGSTRTGVVEINADEHGMCEGHVARDEKEGSAP